MPLRPDHIDKLPSGRVVQKQSPSPVVIFYVCVSVCVNFKPFFIGGDRQIPGAKFPADFLDLQLNCNEAG